MAKLSAFGSAKTQTATKPAKAGAPMFIAADLRDSNGQIVFSQKQIQEAITGYVEGAKLKSQAKTLMETNETIVEDFALTMYARNYATNGRRPDKSPKLLANPDGTGVWLTTAFLDAERNMDANQFAALASVIGKENAEKWTVKESIFSMDNDTLTTELPDLPEVEVMDDDGEPVVINGKPQMRKQTVMDQVDAALSEKFASRPEILEKLFTVKPRWTNRKGMIDALLDCVGRGTPEAATKLVSAFKAGRVTIQLKPGMSGSED